MNKGVSPTKYRMGIWGLGAEMTRQTLCHELSMLPILCRRHSLYSFKSAAEYAFAGKAGGKADIFHRFFRVLEQITRQVHPGIQKVFMGSKAGMPLENPDEMVIA